MMKTKVKTAALPAELPAKLYLAAAAIVLALLAIPHIGHAQGIVRGAQEGSREGNRVAGPDPDIGMETQVTIRPGARPARLSPEMRAIVSANADA